MSSRKPGPYTAPDTFLADAGFISQTTSGIKTHAKAGFV